MERIFMDNELYAVHLRNNAPKTGKILDQFDLGITLKHETSGAILFIPWESISYITNDTGVGS